MHWLIINKEWRKMLKGKIWKFCFTLSEVEKRLYTSLVCLFNLHVDFQYYVCKFRICFPQSARFIQSFPGTKALVMQYLNWFYYSYRYMIMELASSLVEGAKEDLIDLIYSFVKYRFQVLYSLQMLNVMFHVDRASRGLFTGSFKLKSYLVIQATDGIESHEAYYTLSKIIKVCIQEFVF